jgi:hypothetical protein
LLWALTSGCHIKERKKRIATKEIFRIKRTSLKREVSEIYSRPKIVKSLVGYVVRKGPPSISREIGRVANKLNHKILNLRGRLHFLCHEEIS